MKHKSGSDWQYPYFLRKISYVLLTVLFAAATCHYTYGQADQGAITGVIQDPSGAVIPNADVTLTSTDTGLVFKGKSDTNGIYNFSPIKIGNYTVTASAQGFQTTTQTNVHVDVQQRLSVNLKLQPGSVAETVTVTTAPPLMQTQDSSVGQVMSTQTINNIPLNGRNWVYIAQLSAGATPPEGSRGQGKGDFNANGQRAEQNNFILDGVDNNVNVVDFVNGASFAQQPPPDALAEFKVQTGDYSAEFGHSAGAVVNASIKSGTNQIHGDLWEYFRNNVLDARDFDALSVPKYRENQFGATLGFPILKNKLFFFGDTQANRIVFGEPSTLSVPTPLMRQGNFTELLNPSLTGSTQPILLYQPNSGGTALLTCNGQQNVMCGSQIDAVAQKILNMYPLPNTNGGKTYSNYQVNRNSWDNTFQWDARMDYNLSSRDQTYARFSYWHEPGYRPPPLGPVLDGGNFSDNGTFVNLGENFMWSETHVFTPSLTNEFRFGYNYLHTGFLQPNHETNIAPTIGLGGIPYGGAFPQNGGLPRVSINGISDFGSTTFFVTDEHENVFQILDNVTKIVGNHSLKFGVEFQSVRFSTLQPPYPRGTYNYTGLFTSNAGASFTGSGVADFLANQNHDANLSNEFKNGDAHWYRAAYAQDDWRITGNLTLNLGLRYDYFQPYKDVGGYQATYYVTGPVGVGTGSAVYQIPTQQRGFPLAAAFTNLLAKDNITLQYVDNPYLINAQKANFAPRVGLSYSLNPQTVIRAGYGIFYGGLESTGYYPNLGENYPFQFTDTFTAPSCSAGNCPSLSATSNPPSAAAPGINLENGFSNALANGLSNFLAQPALRGSDPTAKTPYTQDWNLTIERSIGNNMAATISYVGDVSRHLAVFPDPNAPMALQNSSANSQSVKPFPDIGGTAYTNYAGESSYNSLQTKLQKRMSNGMSYLVSYTYSHSLDDAPTPLGSTGDPGFRNYNLLPIRYDYSNSAWDTRHRLTFNGYYELPFGFKRRYLNRPGFVNQVAGGWSTNLTFFAQTGNPFTVHPDISTASGGGSRAVRIADPFSTHLSADPSNPGVTCATHTRTVAHWYNPCAFANPLSGSSITGLITNRAQVLQYLGGVRNNAFGPGYERINMSVFKDFTIWHEQFLEFRTDMFNVLNTPAYGEPNDNNTNGSSGGKITTARSFQNFTPDARYFQFSLKYQF